MYKVKNNHVRRTSIPLPGKGIVLSPRGQKGDSALILSKEAKDPSVKLLAKSGAITVSFTPPPSKPKKGGKQKQPTSPTKKKSKKILKE